MTKQNTHGITLRSLVPFLSGLQRAVVTDAAREVDRLQDELDARTSLLMACLSPIEDEFPVTEKLLTDCIKSVLNGEPAQDAVRKYLLEREKQREKL